MENFKKNINDNFEDFYSQNISSDVLNNFRKSSFASLNSLGLPSLKDEDWRFTDLNDFYKKINALDAKGIVCGGIDNITLTKILKKQLSLGIT